MNQTNDIFILRFEAPLMSFGGPIVDNYGIIREFPAQSMLTGLIGNALGYDHRDSNLLQRLQERIWFAARIDRPGKEIIDYQTVDLGQEFLENCGWTTWGEPERRTGATSTASGTHIRYRHYLADGSITVAFTLIPPNENPRLDEIEFALAEPARPLFLGRKCCLPAEPIIVERGQGASLLEALMTHPSRSIETHLFAQWPAVEGESAEGRVVPLTDERDWKNQFHCGKRFVRQGMIAVQEGKP